MKQFDLEQEIMHCWSVCEDLETLAEGVLEHDLTKDQIVNVLIGMQQLYQLKFEKCFAAFEHYIKERNAEKNQMKQGTLVL